MRALPFLVLSLLIGASTAHASGDESCSQSCPSGQVLVSFGDGNSASCLCQEQGSGMVETPSDTITCVDPEDDGSCE
jgi:hypothetical protein